MSKLIAFKYAGKSKKIKITPSAGYDRILSQVAQSFGLVAVELEYEDTADGEVYILSPDEELEETFAQNFKWKVAAPAQAPDVENIHNKDDSGSSLAVSNAASNETDDPHDSNISPKKEMWTDLIPTSWECKTKAQQHPFFISYRQASDSTVAKELFFQIKVALLQEAKRSDIIDATVTQHAFLDAMCLSFGEKWGVNFMSGLYHSGVIILLCSDKSMERMMKADEIADNVLLEWELALQMHEEKGHDILPILLSSQVLATLSDGRLQSLIMEFSTFDHSQFPDRLHKHPLSPGRLTVRQTITKIFEINGPKINPEADVMKIVVEAQEVLNRRKAERQTVNPRSDIALSRSDLMELEKWLSPLWTQMDAERDALLKNFLPGTRQWLLKKVFQFLTPDDPASTSSNRVIWLRGVAGVGKSVMAAVVSRELQSLNLLGGQFFFKHDDDKCSSAHNLVTTLAFGLARFSAHYGKLLLQVKQDKPDILSRSVFEIMRKIVAEPLTELADAGKLEKPVVLVVDALDECGLVNRRHEILLAFQELNRLLPANLKILVTGRPEVDIVEAFQAIPTGSIEPTAEENVQDQMVFAKSSLQALGADTFVLEEGTRILVEKSSGIFVWLVSACKYLSSSNVENVTLEQISNLPDGDKLDGTLDVMYDRIFSGLLDSSRQQNLEHLLARVLAIIVTAFEPLSGAGIASLLDVEYEEKVKRCIRMLEPVLAVDASTKKIRVFHKSVKDYLMDGRRCSILSLAIGEQHSHSAFASLCIRALNKNLKFNMCGLPFSDFHSEIPDFDERMQKGLPEYMRYAVKHFWEHCFDASIKSNISSTAQPLKPVTSTTTSLEIEETLLAELEEFFVSHAHHYLEACSLMDSLHLVIPAMTKLQMLIPDRVKSQQLHTLMEDIKRVLQKFLIPLKASGLQVYFTAIPFSPSDSEFYKAFGGKVPAGVSCPRVINRQPKAWPLCMNVLEGHSAAVYAAAFSPDGELIVSGGADKTIRIWNGSTGQEIRKVEGHSDPVLSTAFSPDGRLVVSGSADKTVRVWNASTGQELRKLDGHSGGVNSTAFNADGQFVVSGSEDGTVKIWNVSTGLEVYKLTGHSGAVLSAAWSLDGQFIVSGSTDKTIRIWSALSGQELLTLEGHYDGVMAAFSPDGNFVVSGSWDKTVRIWNASTGQELHTLEGHSYAVNSVAFSPDGQSVVSGSSDGTVRICDASSGQELCKLEDHSGGVFSVAFSGDGQTIVSGSQDQTVRIWKSSCVVPEPHKQEGHSDSILSAAFSPDGQLVVSGSFDKSVRIWNAFTGKALCKLEGHTAAVFSVAFNPDGQFIVSGSRDQSVRFWNAISGQELHKLDNYSFTNSSGFTADGLCAVLADKDGETKLVDIATGLKVEKHPMPIVSANSSTKSNFRLRSLSGQTLQNQQTILENSLGVWLTFNVTNILCWLPPEFRAVWQLHSEDSIFLLGVGFTCVLQF